MIDLKDVRDAIILDPKPEAGSMVVYGHISAAQSTTLDAQRSRDLILQLMQVCNNLSAANRDMILYQPKSFVLLERGQR